MGSKIVDLYEWNIPASGLLLLQGGKRDVVECHGFADVAAEKQASLSSQFPAASMMHSLFAAVSLQLFQSCGISTSWSLQKIVNYLSQDDGRLALILKHYPILRPHTVIDLLRHTTGVPSYDRTEVYLSALKKKMHKTWQVEAYFDMIVGADNNYCFDYYPAPRGQYCYSTTNLLIISLLVEAMSGCTMKVLVEEFCLKHRVLSDLVVHDRNTINQIQPEHLYHGYLPLSHPHCDIFSACPQLTYNANHELSVLDITSCYPVNASAGLYGFATLPDMLSWMRALLCDEVCGPYQRVFFQDAIAVPMLMAEGDCVRSGLGIMQTDSKEFGRLFWLRCFSYGYESVVVYNEAADKTLGLTVNCSREIVNFRSDSLLTSVMRQLF